MAEFKFVINDRKTGKSYQKAVEDESMVGKKLGETIHGAVLGLEGYELQITGGSDYAGFAMRKDVQGPGRKKSLLSYGVSMRNKRKGLKLRKTVCGNTVSSNIAQINVKVSKYGAKGLDEIFAPAKEEAAPETSAE
jgi:small subunit ribosomal protein S6e